MNHFVCKNKECQNQNDLSHPCSVFSAEKLEKPMECPYLLDDAQFELEAKQEEIKI